MTLYYYGTQTDDALKIAAEGEILSLWEQEIQRLQSLKQKKPDMFRNILNTFNRTYQMTDEELIAFELASAGYRTREINDRVRCVRFFSSTSHIPEPYETILALEFIKDQGSVLFLPRKVPLDGLKEVHFKTREEEHRIAFEKYYPKFIKL